MPINTRRALEALKQLSAAKRSRVEDMLDVEPRMAKYLNAHGVRHLGNAPNPVALMEPETFLKLAMPQTRGKPLERVWHADDVARDLKRAGLGVRSGMDVRQSFIDGRRANDLGGIPALDYVPGYRGDNMGIMGHEGRGRAHHINSIDSLMPVQMLEKNLLTDDERTAAQLNRLATRLKYPDDLRESFLIDAEEYIPSVIGPKPRSRQDALRFLKQKLGVSPESYFYYGAPRKEMNWKDAHKGLFNTGGHVNANY